MIPRSVAMAALLLTAGLLAGCTGTKPLQLDSTIDYVDRMVQLGYPPALVTDRHGQVLAQPVDPDSPKSVQLLLDWEGSSAWVGLNKANTVFMASFDKIHRSHDLGRNWSVAKEFDREGVPEREERDYSFETAMTVDPTTGRIFLYHYTFGVWEPSPNLMACRLWQSLGVPLPCNYGACPALAFSDDEGQQWTETLQGRNPDGASCTNPVGSAGFSSHPKMFTAPRKAALVPAVGDKNPITLPGVASFPYPNALYVCDTMYPPLTGFGIDPPRVMLPPIPKCGVSFDGGNTFERNTVINDDPVGLYTEACQVINLGRPAVAPDGTVYVPLFLFDLLRGRRCAPSVAITEDEGLTWSVRTYSGPRANGTSWDVEPGVAVSADGKVQYYVYRAENQGVYLLRSHDQFRTWKGPYRVSPAAHELNQYVSIVTGSSGRVAVGYFGTTDWQDRDLRQPTPDRADPNTVWKGFITTSFNVDSEEPVFVTDQVTTDQDALQIGCTGAWFPGQVNDPGLADRGYCFNQLNMVYLTLDNNGRLIFGFTDGCDIRNDCTTDFSSGFQARDRQLSLSVQTHGYSMFEEVGLVEPLGLTPPRPAPKCDELCQRP